MPDETYAARVRSANGTATTADAVSCDPTATTGVPAGRPTVEATSGNSVPRVDPGSRSGGRSRVGMPTLSARPDAQSRPRTSYSWVVEAFVRSAPTVPVSQ